MPTISIYQIRLTGHLAPHWGDWFTGVTIRNEPNGEATLTATVRDQAELHGLLAKVRDLNMTLVWVKRLKVKAPETN